MVIACFLPSAAYGGPATVAAQQASELAKRGHDVTVLTTNVLDPRKKEYSILYEEDVQGYRVKRFPAKAFSGSFASIYSTTMNGWLKKHSQEFDVFHIHYARGFTPWAQTEILIRSKAKVFLQPHGMLDRVSGIRKWLDIFITKRHLARAAQVFVLQGYESKIIQKIQKFVQVSIIPNGIDMNSDLPVWRGEENPCPVILFLGRLHPRKRVIEFIKAGYQLIQKYPQIQMRIVGPDGGEEVLARSYINDHGCIEKFIFVGPVKHEEALKEFSNAKIFVLPTNEENFSLAVLEALAIGVPTVVTDTTHNLNVLTEYDAVEVSCPDALSLAKSIDKLLSDPLLRLKRSENGKKTIEQKLSIQRIVDLIEGHYQE
jgi:glycosyltransferase involved in cell wall biosynthesis